MTASHRPRLVWAGALLWALAFGLTGCFASGPTSNSTGADPSTASEPTPSSTRTPAAQMTIASVDVDGAHVTVSGYVSGIVEDGGACKYVATEASTGATVTIDGTGISNVKTSSCGTHQEPISSFHKGSWSVALHYSSSAADITSAAIGLEIP